MEARQGGLTGSIGGGQGRRSNTDVAACVIYQEVDRVYVLGDFGNDRFRPVAVRHVCLKRQPPGIPEIQIGRAGSEVTGWLCCGLKSTQSGKASGQGGPLSRH